MTTNTSDAASPLQVSITSSLLGFMVGAGVFGWMFMQPASLAPLSLYLACLSSFHMLEFLAVSGFSSAPVSVDSFLLDNGKEYVWAIVLPALEFAVEWRFCPALKSFRVARLVGILLVIGGQFLRTWTICYAGHSFNHILTDRLATSHALITDGPYRRIRHPAYTGFFLWSIGLQVLLVNPLSLAIHLCVLMTFFQQRIQAEEQVLLHRFGADYVTYRRKTVSGIPLVD